MSNLLPTGPRRDTALASVRRSARVALHFHPDRPTAAAGTAVVVARAMLADGVYRSQFETGVSNGSVSARPGGARDAWERALFGGAYHEREGEGEGWRPDLRPKYGALDLLRGSAADGPAPRFGSCFFVLRPEVSARCTFTFGGSQDGPRWRATLDEFDGVLAAVLEEAFVRGEAVGCAGVRPPAVMKRIVEGGRDGDGVMSRNLDHYVEAQVHGEVRLGRDVEALVADPSFRGTETGEVLEGLAGRYGFELRWHAGYRMLASDVPSDFRGPTMPSLAARVERDGVIDASAIGDAVRLLAADPGAWEDRGSFEEVLQELKLLWHVLVKFGEPMEEAN